MPGFHAFRLIQAGKKRILQVGFIGKKSDSVPIYLDFEQLSDGQRVIIILYSLLFGLKDLDYTLLLDEPENYVSLPEIQPWLMELNNVCGENFRQVILISHHPELVDYFGPENGVWIEREPTGPTRMQKLPIDENSNLKLSEQMARGWLNE
jgi:predicted ATPase